MELQITTLLLRVNPGIHIAIDSLLLILSFNLKFFLCADMFLYEDSECVSVCLSVPRIKKSP